MNQPVILELTNLFKYRVRQIPGLTRLQVVHTLEAFEENPNNPNLDYHFLGKTYRRYHGYYSINVNARGWLIILQPQKNNRYKIMNVGDHKYFYSLDK